MKGYRKAKAGEVRCVDCEFYKAPHLFHPPRLAKGKQGYCVLSTARYCVGRNSTCNTARKRAKE